ncbi:transcription antitermination factor NusB [Pseudoclavibacter sp. CFCC 13611]|uniref:transcription antitermination factor NusB n=1 Tax=Pseudoclavibacter sp. CFCC 13611 TaxID=2615178 RepID=UPI00130119B6|nr:transcription antitermination factor NusB [Pseudoclavibacter sp. CFCC 13611]KAB1663437.1 rRNA small subunit methyltransferase B [Pseudoclavibacter sp. CFCC 13611]
MSRNDRRSDRSQSRRHDSGRNERGGDRPQQRRADPRRLALGVLEEVDANDAYANLLLPARLADSGLEPRDRGFVTELVYGTLRWRALYDELISRAARRDASELDRRVRDILRLGAHQALHMRVPGHAAVNETVSLAKRTREAKAAGLINAVMRRLTERSLDEWVSVLQAELPADRYLSVRWSHPEWIVRALRKSLAADGRDGDLEALLAADNAAPAVNLVALPGVADRADIPGTTASPLSPFGAVLEHGDPLELCRRGVRVQDVGSQLAALALAAAPDGGDRPGASADDEGERWLDLCAGPGGKTALLAALAARHEPKAALRANEPVPHRADLVRRALEESGFGAVTVDQHDGATELGRVSGQWHRLLIDAPCTGLGALRRRPESRWRKQPTDLRDLTALQQRLLDAAVASARPGALIAYVTCSPHLAETRRQIDALLARQPGTLDVLDTAGILVEADAGLGPGAASGLGASDRPLVGSGAPGLQLWPHVHASDGMFVSVLRRR